MIQMLLTGGPVTWVLFACGFSALIVFLERLFNLHRAQIAADDFLKGIYTVLGRGNTTEAATLCEEAPGPVARLALAAVLHHEDGAEELEEALEAAGLEEIPRMERGLGWIATVGKLAPLLGLLGTVLGLLDMLRALRAGAPLVQVADLSGGLWKAVTVTALGLTVGILAYAGHNFLVGRVESIALDMERAAASLKRHHRGAEEAE